MNILIDTNVLIPLEDTGRSLDADLAEMVRLCSEQDITVYIHPEQKEDVEQDKDEARKAIVLSRLRQYQQIPNPPQLTTEEIELHQWRDIKRNDRIDNLLLASLVRGAIQYLVSEDRGVHKKARNSNFSEKVLRIPQFLQLLRWQQSEELPSPVGIETKYAHEFNVEDVFFDSLREGYDGFNAWWGKCCGEHRQLWCVAEEGRPLAICVFKKEESGQIAEEKQALSGEHLKICTFKVSEEIQGQRIGERLLHTAFEYACFHHTPWVYLHADASKHRQLIELCQDYGFEEHGSYKGDDVYVKSMDAPEESRGLTPLDYAIKYHPHFLDHEEVQKFFVPIMPKYHERLFPDISDLASGLTGQETFPFLQAPGYAGNTIKKAYICHSKISKLYSGDLVFFYRSHDRHAVEVVGVVESATHVTTIDDLRDIVFKRTVYSIEELSEMIKKRCLVILFRTMKTFPAINLSDMKEIGLSHPQSITQIDHCNYESLTKGGSNGA